MNEKTLISRQNLAKRWDYTSTKVIENYEAEGIITRVPGLPSPRYSLEEIIKIETTGEINPLSPLERMRFERKIEALEEEVDFYRQRMDTIRKQVI
ncbi:transcription factor [Clostridium sp.]|uniref:transcription factor n=1 Tax=Clostridium sp. TaxID=1506 RepID=UPI00260AC294|nr:transcription factor [Clostridium sp.]